MTEAAFKRNIAVTDLTAATGTHAVFEPIAVAVVVDVRAGVRASLLAAISEAGAIPELYTDAAALANGAAVDAVVFDVGAAPERLQALATTLTVAPATRSLPRILVVDGSVTAAALAPFGAASLVPSTSRPEVLRSALAAVVDQVRERNALRRLADAASADIRALEEALSTVKREGGELSHDARVFFGIILGYAANLRDGLGGPITEEQRRQLVNIVDASNDAAALLDRFVTELRRTLSKPAPSVLFVPRAETRRQVDLVEVGRGTIALFEGIARAKDIDLRAVSSTPVLSWCDPLQIKQALVNLIGNALKFTPPGGRVEVLARHGQASTARGDEAERRDVEVVVSDTGPGIPERERERVFERGARLARDHAKPGTGVGLAIVREIATLHGGLTRVDETPGGGASIAIVLPADRRARGPDPRFVKAIPRYSLPPGVEIASPAMPDLTGLRRRRE